MLSRLTSVLSIVMICLVVVLLSYLTEIGVRIEKLIDPHNPITTTSGTTDIDIEIMRRLQRIGTFTGTGFLKSGDVRKDQHQIPHKPE
jgi:hypothetical protein